MALWGNQDLANNAPKYAPTLVGQVANTGNQTALYASGSPDKPAVSGTFTVNTTAAVITAASGNTADLFAGQRLSVANATSNTANVTILAVTNSTSATLTANASVAVTAGSARPFVQQGQSVVGVFALDATEASGSAASQGWVLRKVLSNGRVQMETLVAMKSVGGSDGDGDTV